MTDPYEPEPFAGNPENNWVHVSIKSANGTIVDARAEDGETLKALVDGAVGTGTYLDFVEKPFQASTANASVEGQAIQNLQNGGLVQPNPGLQPNAWQPAAQEAPVCAHGPKKWVAAGVSRSTGKPYPAFWACQAPQGMPKCRG